MLEQPVLLVTRKLPEAVEARATRDYNAILNKSDEQFRATDLIERSKGVDAILTCSTEIFSAKVIESLAPSVKAIATFSVGYEHIDTNAAKKRDLILTNTPDVLTDATADLTILLMLGAARRAFEWGKKLRDGQWGRWSATELLGTDLRGKRLGIYGMGRIGRAVASRARSFGMLIHYHNRSKLIPELEVGAVYHKNANDMLPQIDILSLNCPATPETIGFLNAERIATMRDKSIVLNSARGSVVVDDALIQALQSGKLAAAGLDVFDQEPKLDQRYLTLENTFLMPHIGSATLETRNEMGFRALDNLDAIFLGKEPGDRII
ncbi:MAG: D-glycerate dehydrogenase [Rickettsiales bacterium]|jgi:lactate dehydrogenase-like 2-hydroxyacid dehydrogenase|nr:D-glycerate dehydrogenase [Rickettsiales bacterium]